MPSTVVVDSNLLFVLVVGCTSREHIGRARRTEKYLPADFDLLQTSLAEFEQILVTPHVLAETSNLLGYLSEPLLSKTRRILAGMVPLWTERFNQASELICTPTFVRLGFTDSALFSTASASITLLTDDLPLYLAACKDGRAAINFTHLREERGNL